MHVDTDSELVLRLPEKVRRDTLVYRGQVERFARGELSRAAFQACRVPMGVYEQRKGTTYMVHVRVGAGLVSSAQLRCIAELSRKYGNGVVHVTTRQDFQIHEVKIEQTPDVLDGLLDAGLTSCGDGGSTVRNVTACPRAGVCPFEQFNVSPHAIALAQYLRQFDSSYNLPRKYKIVFAGCDEDCARASVTDLGFFARRRNGMKGFAVYAGGGLDGDPAARVRIDDFVEQREIFDVAEAIKRLFDRYSDRSNNRRARLRHVLARFGPEEFTRLYRKERESIRRQGLEGELPAIAESPDGPGVRTRSAAKVMTPEPTDSDLLPEKDKHFHTLKLRPPLRGVLADDLIRIAQIAETYGAGIIQITRQRSLLVPSIPKTRIKAVHKELQTLSIEVSADGQPKAVACAGASTYKLGLCLSRRLARAISNTLARVERLTSRVETLSSSLCASLKLRLEPVRPAGQPAEFRSPIHELDLRGVPCPLNLVKAKLAIEKIPIGDVIEIDLDEGEPIRNVPVSLGRQGQEILDTAGRENHSCVRIRRRL